MTWLYDAHIHLSDTEYEHDIPLILNSMKKLCIKACCVSMDYPSSIKTLELGKKNDFIHDFNILSVQRNLKIIGIFSRLFKRDKKKQYLKLIPYTWKLLEIRLKDKMFSEINTILNQFVPSKTRAKTNFYAN